MVGKLTVVDEEDSCGPVRDFVGYGRHGLRAFWPNRAKVAVAIVVNYESGAEDSWPSGQRRNDKIHEFPYPEFDQRYRDLAAESAAEFGSRAGVWRIQRLLDEYGVKATFSGCAVAFARNPELGAYLKEALHEVASHGYRWERAWLLSREEERRRIAKAIKLIEEVCGRRPVGWQSRHGGSVNTRELLVEEGGFLYDCDASNDDLPYYVQVKGKRHLVVPYSSVYNDSKFVIPQGYARPADYFENCRVGFDYLRREGATHPKMMTLGVHAHWMGQASRASALRSFIEYALQTGEVWFATRGEIASWWHEHHAEFTTNAG